MFWPEDQEKLHNTLKYNMPNYPKVRTLKPYLRDIYASIKIHNRTPE